MMMMMMMVMVMVMVMVMAMAMAMVMVMMMRFWGWKDPSTFNIASFENGQNSQGTQNEERRSETGNYFGKDQQPWVS